jgi:Zn-dependent protease
VGRDIPLGRIAGIKIGMSLSVPIVALVYAFTLAQNRFPITVPGQTDTDYWIAGIAGALLFFVSLLAHEVGHALVARREGIGVQGISLWLLGGVAKLEHEADNAGAELRIAGIGPLTSFAVGVVFWFFHQAASGGTGLSELYAELFGWLAFINILLAAFNLLPGSPLDGGRVLSALLWMRTRDQTSAQASAARFGQVLGAGLATLGLLLLFNDSNPNGVFVAFVGAYILFSATSELRATASMGLLRGVRLSEVMDVDPPVLPAWMTVHDLVATAHRYEPHTAFPIRDLNGRIAGLLTAEAVQASDPRVWPTLRLSDLAFPIERVQTARTDDSVLVTVQRSRTGATGRVLVLHPDGRVAGVVGTDVADRALQVQRVRHGQVVAAR